MKAGKYIISLIAVFILSSGLGHTQDTMYLIRNNIKRFVKIEEVGGEFIRYVKPGSENREKIMFKRIRKIILSNGDSIVNHLYSSQQKIFYVKRNLVSLYLEDMALGNLRISYQRLNKTGELGIRIPLSIGYTSRHDIFWVKQKFGIGLAVDFYPTGQGRFKYFCGTEIRYINGVDGEWSYHNRRYRYYDTDFFTALVNNGFVYNPSDHFNITVYLGLGLKNFTESPADNNYISITGWFSYSMGYRF